MSSVADVEAIRASRAPAGKWGLKAILLAALALASILAICLTQRHRTRDSLEEVEARAKMQPGDFKLWNQIADARLRLAATSGDLDHLVRASEAVRHSLDAQPDSHSNPVALLMQSRVNFSSHRFVEARAAAERLIPFMSGKPIPFRVLGDALFQFGDIEGAEAAWKQMMAFGDNPLAIDERFAQLDLIYGRPEDARRRLASAAEVAAKLAPPSPDSLAWCRVQLGEVAFRMGDWEAAETQYQGALNALPGYYSAVEHLAELRGAQGRLEEAVNLYRGLIARLPRPDFLQALGDLYFFNAKPADAAPWYDRAQAAYLASAEGAGEPMYFHHLAGFYADSRPDSAKALEWARRDLACRHSVQAYDALAWAYCKAGKNSEALEASAKALATGIKDAHILYHAAMIRMAAGDILGGSAAMRQALEANPRYNTFHVHR